MTRPEGCYRCGSPHSHVSSIRQCLPPSPGASVGRERLERVLHQWMFLPFSSVLRWSAALFTVCICVSPPPSPEAATMTRRKKRRKVVDSLGSWALVTPCQSLSSLCINVMLTHPAFCAIFVLCVYLTPKYISVCMLNFHCAYTMCI